MSAGDRTIATACTTANHAGGPAGPSSPRLSPSSLPRRGVAPSLSRAPAFSLLELMIAIVILGIGLIMVATMFPIAWTRARDLAEFTTQQTLTATAEEMCKLLLRVDAEQTELGSFAGDLIWNRSTGFTAGRSMGGSNLVHYLHMQNISAARYEYVPPPPRNASAPSVAPPWLVAGMRDGREFNLDPLRDMVPDDPFFTRGFGGAQIRVEQRVYPPMEPYQADKLLPTGQPDPTKADSVWDANLDARRYAFGVFHKLIEPVIEIAPGATVDELRAGLAEDREFNMYYVTLRRTRPTLRFAVQDPAEVPDPFSYDQPVPPKELIGVYDVLLPEPWRVQIYFEVAPIGTQPTGNQIGQREFSTGLPSVAQINHPDFVTGPLAIDFLERGTPFIDERSGQVYEVTEIRRAGTGNTERAFVTLDKEVFTEDVEDTILLSGNAPRVVWVFPPPIERETNGTPIFSGGSPVVGIDTGTLKVSPQR